MVDQPPPGLDFQRKLALDRIERLASWSSILLLLCGSLTAAAVWDWRRTGGHWYPSCVHATRLFLVMGIYAIARTCLAQRYPCTVMNVCVILIALISVSIVLENPEVEVHYHAKLGEVHRNMKQTFHWLEHVLPPAEFDTILAAASKALNNTSSSNAPPFPMACPAQEMRRGTPNVLDSRCYQHEGFTFNLTIGHAFLLSTALHSGLTCACCMASWLLSQIFSVILLVAHNAPSWNIDFYSVASIMVLSFFLCLSVSLWMECHAKMGGLFRGCFPSQWQSVPSCNPQHLISSSTLGGMDTRTLIASEAGTLEPVSNLQERNESLAFDTCAGDIMSKKVQQVTESQLQSSSLLKIQCSNGLQATCSSEDEVFIEDDAAKYRKVKAGDLAIGAKAMVVHVSKELIAAVTVQPAPNGVKSFGLAHENAFLFAVDPMSDMAIAAHPEIRWVTGVQCWGPDEAHTHQVAPQAWSNNEFSPLMHSGNVLSSWVEDTTRKAQGMDGQFYSCESQFHSHSDTH